MLAAPLLASCLAKEAAVGPTDRGPSAAGEVRVLSNPSGARIYLDGEITQFRTPTLLSAISSGGHSVRLTSPGYRDWIKKFKLAGGQSLIFEATLVPVGTGSLEIQTVPSGARIFIDGQKMVRQTPTEIPNLIIGTHTILLQREGYEDLSQAVVVTKGRNLQIRLVLKPLRSILGVIQIWSHPAGAKIFLDGYPTGKQTPEVIYNVLPGYRNWVEDISVREEHTENLLVNLQKISGKSTGSVQILTEPPGAEIVMDGIKLRQQTPAELESVPPGTYYLKISADGFQTWIGEVNVEPEARTSLEIKLEQLPENRPGREK
jgi:hypothetical protein